MENIIKQLQRDFPNVTFTTGEAAHWAPSRQMVVYNPDAHDASALWGLFHELSHALLDHTAYSNDLDLLLKEASAWEAACSLAGRYGQAIAADYIQDCLDTYRTWLYRRSSCPQCDSHGIQTSDALYYCANCANTWHVSGSRHCRTYRLRNHG